MAAIEELHLANVLHADIWKKAGWILINTFLLSLTFSSLIPKPYLACFVVIVVASKLEYIVLYYVQENKM